MLCILVAHPGDSCVGDGGAPPEHLAPPPVPDEAAGPLLHDLHAEGACKQSSLSTTTSASNEGYPKVRNHGEGPY